MISAIHFIGPNKPWKSLGSRAPGMKSEEKPELGPQQTYDYSALLDRWFEVYDRHYRSTPHTTVSDFQVQRYVSVWHETKGSVADKEAVTPGNGWGLDELKRIALNGYHSSSASHRPEEGEYRSLPLDGRVDLMRPKDDIPDDPTNDDASEEIAPSGTPRIQQGTPANSPGGRATEFDIHSLGATTPTAKGWAPTSSNPVFASHADQSAVPPQADDRSRPPLVFTPITPEQSTLQDSPYHASPYHASPHYLQAQLQSPQLEEQPFQVPRMPHFYSNLHFQQMLVQTKSAQLQQGQHHHSPIHHRSSLQSPSHSPTQRLHSHHDTHSSRGGHRRRDPTHSPANERESPDSSAHHIHPHSRHVHFKAGHHSPVVHHHHHHHHSPQVGSQQSSSPRLQRQHGDQTGTSSPPQIPWNPAVEPPPHVRPESVFPEDTYFPNVWDQTPSQLHDATFQSFEPPPSTPQSPLSEVFFHPPPPSTIPEQLIREGQFSNILGSVEDITKGDSPSVPSPDRSKVKSVFPWEDKPRHVPRRVFPAVDTPPPSTKFIEEDLAASPPKVSPMQEAERPRPSSYFSAGIVPSSMTTPNVWDTVPSIQRYASRLVRPNDAFPQPAPPPPENGWRKWEKMRERDWQERQDASSMDGDDEDDGDDDDDVSDNDAKGQSKKDRQRRGSSSSVSRVKKEYRVRGVQTETPQMVEEEIQVSVLPAVTTDGKITSPPLFDERPIPQVSKSIGTETRRDWPSTSSSSSLLPPAVLRIGGTEAATWSPGTTPRSSMPFPSMSPPSRTRSPATASPGTYSPAKRASPPKVSTPPVVESPRVSFGRPPAVIRRGSTPSPSVSPTLHGSPRGILSPRYPGSPRTLSTGSIQKPGSPMAGTTVNRSAQTTPPPKQPPRLSSPFAPQIQIQRSVSTETTATISPSSTHSSSLITPDNTPVLGPRKAGRVWDPARGVEAFKRSSEEVLARFLRIGSFDDDPQKQSTSTA